MEECFAAACRQLAGIAVFARDMGGTSSDRLCGREIDHQLKKLGATRGMFGLYRAFKAQVIGVTSSRPMKKTGANPQNGRSGNPAVEPPIRHHCPVPSRSR